MSLLLLYNESEGTSAVTINFGASYTAAVPVQKRSSILYDYTTTAIATNFAAQYYFASEVYFGLGYTKAQEPIIIHFAAAYDKMSTIPLIFDYATAYNGFNTRQIAVDTACKYLAKTDFISTAVNNAVNFVDNLSLFTPITYIYPDTELYLACNKLVGTATSYTVSINGNEVPTTYYETTVSVDTIAVNVSSIYATLTTPATVELNVTPPITIDTIILTTTLSESHNVDVSQHNSTDSAPILTIYDNTNTYINATSVDIYNDPITTDSLSLWFSRYASDNIRSIIYVKADLVSGCTITLTTSNNTYQLTNVYTAIAVLAPNSAVDFTLTIEYTGNEMFVTVPLTFLVGVPSILHTTIASRTVLSNIITNAETLTFDCYITKQTTTNLITLLSGVGENKHV